jgi:hypothetical protein
VPSSSIKNTYYTGKKVYLRRVLRYAIPSKVVPSLSYENEFLKLFNIPTGLKRAEWVHNPHPHLTTPPSPLLA